jgi:ABC-type uncharacterized transport system YnjBCD ATPase subunit
MGNNIEHFKHANHHDLGGRDEFLDQKVCKDDDELDHGEFGARVDALRLILGAKKIMLTDELRRGVEAIPRDEYFHLQYYERWLRSMCSILIEKGIVEPKELM